jgi:hypothetical protein
MSGHWIMRAASGQVAATALNGVRDRLKIH